MATTIASLLLLTAGMSGEALFARMGESDMKVWSILDVGANDGESTLQVTKVHDVHVRI